MVGRQELEGETKPVVVKKKTRLKIGPLWEPLANQVVYATIQELKAALLKIKDAEAYRATGKTPYVGFRVAPKRTFANIHLSPKRALVRIGRVLSGKTLWDTTFKITEDGIAQDGNSFEIGEIVDLAKDFIDDKEWV